MILLLWLVMIHKQKYPLKPDVNSTGNYILMSLKNQGR
jgi:hypothetical protein